MINLVTTKKCSKIFEIVLTICQIRYKIASTRKTNRSSNKEEFIFGKRNNVITYTVNKATNRDMYITIQNGEVIVNAPWYFTQNKIQAVVEFIVSKENPRVDLYLIKINGNSIRIDAHNMENKESQNNWREDCLIYQKGSDVFVELESDN